MADAEIAVVSELTAGPPPAPPPTSVGAARRRAAGNTVWNFLSFGVTVVAGFWIWPLQVHILGDAAFGFWGFLQQLIAYALLLDFGIRIAVMRNLARLQTAGAETSPEATGRLLSTALIVTAIPAVAIGVAGLLGSVWLPAHLGLPPGLADQARWATLLASAAIALAVPGATFTSCLVAISRYDLMNLRIIAVQFLRVALLWYFLTHGFGLVAVAAIFLVAQVSGEAVELALAVRHVPGFRLHWRLFDRQVLRFLLNFGFFAFLLSIAVRLLYLTDNIVVGACAGAAAVTYFSIGGTLVEYLRSAVANVTKIFGPLTAQLDALGDRQALRQLYLNGARLGMAVAVPAVVVLSCGGYSLLRLWMGARLAGLATPALTILALTGLVFPGSVMYGHVLYAMNRHRVSACLAVVEGGVNLGLSVVLYHRIGLAGVAWGTLLPAILFQMILLPAYTNRLLALSWSQYTSEAVVRPLLAALPLAGMLAYASRQGWLRSWATFIAACLALALLWAGVAWALLAKPSEREWARRRWRWRRRPLPAPVKPEIAA